MKATIQHIIEPMALGTFAEFSTTYGTGRSFFSSSTLEENQTYDVEMEIDDDDFIWNTNISPSTDCIPSLYFYSGKLCKTAKLISSDEDGDSELKLGDSIIFISIDEIDLPLPLFINLTAQKTTLYPTNI